MTPRYFTREYEKSCKKLGDCFAQRYFGKDYEQWWVADDVTGVMYINDRFFNVKDMYEYINHKYTAEQMFEHYDHCINELMAEASPICIRDWKKLNKQHD